jgi:choline dehydrogenase-like flavoprotein
MKVMFFRGHADDHQDTSPVLEHGMSLSRYALKPLSRGKVALRKASPFSKPLRVHDHYAEPERRGSMIEGIRACREIAAQTAMRAHITRPHRTPKSESNVGIWENVQRNVFHPTGTCHRARGGQLEALPD